MGKESTESAAASSPVWETLEAFARESMQQLLQRMLEAEVDGYLAELAGERDERGRRWWKHSVLKLFALIRFPNASRSLTRSALNCGWRILSLLI